MREDDVTDAGEVAHASGEPSRGSARRLEEANHLVAGHDVLGLEVEPATERFDPRCSTTCRSTRGSFTAAFAWSWTGSRA